VIKNSTEQPEQNIAQQNAELQIIERKEAIQKKLLRYFTGKPCKYGHVDERLLSSRKCITCIREDARKEREHRSDYFKEYYQSEEYKERKKILKNKPENRARRNERARELYYEQHGKSKRTARDKYNSMTEEQTRSMRETRKKLLDTSADARMLNTMRNTLNRCLRLTGRKKSTRTEPMLGYSKSDLVSHIEGLFSPEMNWGNYGDYWEIDHINPVSKMIKNGITDMKIINALSNLQPLTVDENRAKSDKDNYYD